MPFVVLTAISSALAPVLAKPVNGAALLNLVKRVLSISAGVVPMRRDDRA